MTAIALITTTINIPHVLLDYARDAKAHGRELKIYVTGDRKTPLAAAEFCASIDNETGVYCEYMDVAAQDAFMKAYPLLDAHIPWNCVQRRDVAILKAVADGAEIVVTIDDDNFLATTDYFGAHCRTGTDLTLDAFGDAGQWFNICRFLAEESNRQFFPRGYGMAARSIPAGDMQQGLRVTKRAIVNAGLWLGDPDIDAITRLATPVNATHYTRDENFFVATGTWTSFNSQNTAIAKEALPAYFLSPYVGRYDDIFISYVVKRIADHFDHGICFGQPLVKQERNEHNLYHDLALEGLGMKITDDFIAILEKANLSGANYADCLLQLCEQSEAMLRDVDMTIKERAQMVAFFAGCRIWAALPLW